MPSAPHTMQTVSPDQLKKWSRCKKQFYYQYMQKLRWPTDKSNFVLGSDVHKLMDYQSRGLDCEAVLQSADTKTRLCWEKLSQHTLSQLPIIANEWGFQIPVKDQWLTGRIDRIARDPETNKVLIIDWKTGTAAPKLPQSDWQTIIYFYAVIEARQDLGLPDLTPEQLEFVYVEVSTKNENAPVRVLSVPYSAQQHAINRALIEKTLTAIEAEEDYALPNQCPDTWCAYRSICGIENI